MGAIIFEGNVMVRGQLSGGQFSLGAIFLGGNCTGGNFPRRKLFGGQLSRVWGNHPGGKYQGGQFSSGAVVRTPPESPQKALLLLKVILTAADMRQIAIFVSFQKVLFSTLYISTSLAPTVSQIAAGQYL